MSESITNRTACRVGHLVLWVAISISLGGCIVLPANHYGALSRNNISHETSSLLHPGSTTMEDVFILLGEPDYAAGNGQELGYIWRKVKWVYGDTTGGTLEFGTSYVLLVSFDDSHFVSDVNIKEISDWEHTPEQIPQSDE